MAYDGNQLYITDSTDVGPMPLPHPLPALSRQSATCRSPPASRYPPPATHHALQMLFHVDPQTYTVTKRLKIVDKRLGNKVRNSTRGPLPDAYPMPRGVTKRRGTEA